MMGRDDGEGLKDGGLGGFIVGLRTCSSLQSSEIDKGTDRTLVHSDLKFR